MSIAEGNKPMAYLVLVAVFLLMPPEDALPAHPHITSCLIEEAAKEIIELSLH